MNNMIRSLLLPFMVVGMMAVGVVGLGGSPVAAVTNPLDASCKDATLAKSDVCKSRKDRLFGADSFWTRLINTLIYVVGAVAVLMIIVGGLRYVLSGGDASQTKNAKDTILYAIIGVVIAIMAYAIVNFVVINLVK